MPSPVRIAVALSSMNSEAWIAPLRDACARAGIAAQLEAFEGKPLDARYAVVWLPPAELFTTERGLRAVFNAGAGVERLLAMPGLPPELPILRLVDAGMAPKMAEYVCFYIARISRGLHRFGGPSAERDWNVDRPRGTPPTVGVLGLGAIGAQIAQAAALFGYPVRGWSRTARGRCGSNWPSTCCPTGPRRRWTPRWRRRSPRTAPGRPRGSSANGCPSGWRNWPSRKRICPRDRRPACRPRRGDAWPRP